MTAGRVLGCWTIMVGLAACSTGPTGTTRFATWVNPVEVAPVQRLVVFESVESPYFDASLHQGFVIGLRQRFASCGVQASVERLAALDIDRARRITDAIASFRAGTVLVIRAAGGERKLRGVASTDSLRFDVELVDVATRKTKWSGAATLDRERLQSTDDVGSGVRFATSFVERLRDDGVLAGCPAPDAVWPEIKARAPEVADVQESAYPSFSSRLEAASAPPVKRLVVYEDVDGAPVEPAMHTAFAGEVVKRLEECGVKARVATSVGLATDAAELTASARAFAADTALVVRQSGGTIVHGGTGDLVFELELIELGSSKATWRARMKLGFVSPRSSSDAAASGRDMGANIVARLRDDHALAGCPDP